MQLAIVQNPHVKEPKTLWRELDSMDNTKSQDTFYDKEGLQSLKKIMSEGRTIKVI